MFGILQWYAWSGPRWLASLTWNMERSVARYFSVGLMLRTLISHWHKDSVSYKQGTLSKIFIAFAWNLISRAVGFIVRVSVLVLYVLVAMLVLVVGVVGMVFFLAWPALAILLMINSL